MTALLAALLATWIATPVRTIDGDTFEARVDVWPRQAVVVSVRIIGIDAPELRGRCEDERMAALRARVALDEALTAAGTVYLVNVQEDAYAGRVDADVYDPNGASLAARMLAAGLAVPMGTRRTKDWCAP